MPKGQLVTVIKDIKIDNSFEIYYEDNHFMNRIIHIRAIVDKDKIVFKQHSKRKGWRYQIEYNYFFKLLIKHKHLYKRK